jgi:hypothetical protein
MTQQTLEELKAVAAKVEKEDVRAYVVLCALIGCVYAHNTEALAHHTRNFALHQIIKPDDPT